MQPRSVIYTLSLGLCMPSLDALRGKKSYTSPYTPPYTPPCTSPASMYSTCQDHLMYDTASISLNSSRTTCTTQTCAAKHPLKREDETLAVVEFTNCSNLWCPVLTTWYQKRVAYIRNLDNMYIRCCTSAVQMGCCRSTMFILAAWRNHASSSL